MSKFRPNSYGRNIYCIPDIHSNYSSLNLILSRILPLKRADKIIFLGDYIDRNDGSYEVIETLISLRKKYTKDNIIFLRGNHEQLLLNSLGLGSKGTGFSFDEVSDYAIWINNGGVETIINYAKHAGVEIKNPKALTSSRCLSFINKEHVKFLQEETQLYYELEIDNHKFQFAHAAIDPNVDIDKQDEGILLWDRSLYTTVKSLRLQGKEPFWAKDKTIITGHNYNGIYCCPGFMMLDMSQLGKLAVLELNSMTAFTATKGHDRLVKYNIIES